MKSNKQEALQQAFKNYRESHVCCTYDGCRSGFVYPDPLDIDFYTGEPRGVSHKLCGGSGFLHIQMELPFDQA